MSAHGSEPFQALEVRVRGCVQGVGFRPTIWHIARELGLAGEVLNDSEGVLLRIGGDRARLALFLEGIERRLPPLARVDSIETQIYAGALPSEFRISQSSTSRAHTQVAPDAAICQACSVELFDETNRHYRYPFTTCTHCGPRLSIVTAIPYDRATTTMAPFGLCPDCRAEHGDPTDRRFHAEAIACPRCGPTARLIALQGVWRDDDPALDDIERAAKLVAAGEIIAIKGIGGYQLACDALNAQVLARLRQLKRRPTKPFALMARDLDVIRNYCTVNSAEERELTGVQAPIVLLQAHGRQRLPDAVAPGLNTLGFMLPTTPLHILLLQNVDAPWVMTSGNISEEPQIIDDAEARERLGGIASYALVHNRRIANRVDDSVVRVLDGKSRVLRRARGFAPNPIKLPTGFVAAPELLAMGGELKSTFCLLKDGQAILSQHQGDLENTETFDDYRKNLALYRQIFSHECAAIVIDRHPEYLSSKWGRAEAERHGLPLLEVQHHHAHIAACLAENGFPLDGPMVLGIVLDGLGFGDDGAIWGGELLLADYRRYQRLARLKPIAMPGGAQAVREPWRNLHAHLRELGWNDLESRLPELHARLHGKRHTLLDAMIAKQLNTPFGSSCGRLFDAVAAALDVCFERQDYEGEAAIRLEALAESSPSFNDGLAAYPFAVVSGVDNIMEINPTPMWNALFSDLACDVSRSTIALRFHMGLSAVVVETAHRLARRDTNRPLFEAVALSGGCFQNRLLFETVAAQLRDAGFVVLTHAEVPANDGGLALGQAAIGAALLLEGNKNGERTRSCVSAFQAASSE
jgi:hydrogenase maturation protein HypF